jgi:lipoprotein NlpD
MLLLFKYKGIKPMWLKITVIGICLSFWVAGCTSPGKAAPVRDVWNKPMSTQRVHVAQKGDTLYSVAWRYGKDYRDLALINGLHLPYAIATGQRIHLIPSLMPAPSPSNPAIIYSPAKTQPKGIDTHAVAQAIPSVELEPHVAPPSAWQWPSLGKIIHHFAVNNGGNKGIDIAGIAREPVLATAAGKVVYAGNGLRGYGNLLIVKHNEEFLSAYAHNSKLLVKEGDLVKAGQVIAEMGDTEAQQVMLHFEIRQAGKPVDPMQYLSRR